MYENKYEHKKGCITSKRTPKRPGEMLQAILT